MLSRRRSTQQFTITVPKPCSEDWSKMNVVDHEHRHCDSCAITVTDFSAMSDDELILHLKHGSNITCGRFAATQLNRSFNSLPKKQNPAKWWKSIALLHLVLLGKDATAQQQDSTVIPVDSSIAAINETDSLTEIHVAETDSVSVADTTAVAAKDSADDKTPEPVATQENRTIMFVSETNGMMVLGGFGGPSNNTPTSPFWMDVADFFRKPEVASPAIVNSNPNNLSSEDPNKIPEAPQVPAIPEAPWYQAILPEFIRTKRKA